jgi:predicted dienelactone hydrolase
MDAETDAGVERMAADIRFVLHELMRLDKGHSGLLPLAGHLDFRRVGAFGHSEGGEAAAHACQTEKLLRACLDRDGVRNFAPFHPDSPGWGMDQPFMLLTRERDTPPTDSELEAMRMTRPQVEALIARLKAAQEAALSSTGGGSYKVLMKYGLASHMSFSDLPVLEARDNAEADRQSRLLNVIRIYTRTFFDEELGHAKRIALENLPPSEFVDSVRYFEPAKRTHRH